MHTVMNSAGEVTEFLTGKAPERTDLEGPQAPKPEVKVREKAESQLDENIPEWVKRLNISAEQHRGITEVITRAVGKKHGQAKEAEEFAAEQYNTTRMAEQRADSLALELAALKKQAEPTVVKSAEPQRESFPDDMAYFDARSDWRADLKYQARLEADEAAREQLIEAELTRVANERVATARELVPDWNESVTTSTANVPPIIASYMRESPLYTEIAYHFSKNAKAVDKVLTPINDMLKGVVTDSQAFKNVLNSRAYARAVTNSLVELGKIESTLKPFAPVAKVLDDDIDDDIDYDAKSSAANGSKPNRDAGFIPSLPRAPAPVIQPLSVSSNSMVEKPQSRMDYAESKADWEKKHAKQFARRKRH